MERLTPTKSVTHIKLDYPLHLIAFVNFQRSTDFSRFNNRISFPLFAAFVEGYNNQDIKTPLHITLIMLGWLANKRIES